MLAPAVSWMNFTTAPGGRRRLTNAAPEGGNREPHALRGGTAGGADLEEERGGGVARVHGSEQDGICGRGRTSAASPSASASWSGIGLDRMERPWGRFAVPLRREA